MLDVPRRFCKSWTKIRKDNYVFVDASDGSTWPPNVLNTVDESYWVLDQAQQIMTIQRKKLPECATADRVTFKSQPTGVPQMLSKKSTTDIIQDKNMKLKSSLGLEMFCDSSFDMKSQWWNFMKASKYSVGNSDLKVYYLYVLRNAGLLGMITVSELPQ